VLENLNITLLQIVLYTDGCAAALDIVDMKDMLSPNLDSGTQARLQMIAFSEDLLVLF